MDEDLAARVEEVLAVDPEEFRSQVAADASVVRQELADGTFDNPQGIVGLEVEFYAVQRGDSEQSYREGGTPGALARVPRRLLEYVGFEKELGLHNAEMSTSPQPLNDPGLRAQSAEVAARVRAATGPMRSEGLRLVSDGMWTIPPEGETAAEYLTASVDDDGIDLASNMSQSVRYHAMTNSSYEPRMELDAPHVHLQADTVMPESLITSIQPHYQVAQAADLPTYFNYAVRVAGPLLALGTNAPFFPPDLYDDGVDPEAVLADARDEERVHVFESVLNEHDHEKVQFPRDLTTAGEAVDRVATDRVAVPMPVSRGDRFDDRFAHWRRKHGTYWRWVRPVFGGASRSAANARIEFRPLPGQPTIADTIAFQAAFGGLMAGLVQREHPVANQDWETARENFYAAARDGIDADLAWVTNEGTETTDRDAVFTDVLDHARAGLEAHGLSAMDAAGALAPLRARAEAERTPADWKRHQVRQRLDDGAGLADAIQGMQRAYVRKQAETFYEGTFADWSA